MLNIGGRLALFFSSYSPLFFVLAVKAYEHPQLSWLLVAVGILGGASLPLVLSAARSLNPIPIGVKSSEIRSGDVVAYLFTYIVPFVGVDATSPANLFAMAIVGITIALVFANSDLVLVNPLLAGAGFHLHRVETKSGTSYLVLSRRSVSPTSGVDLLVHRLGDRFGEEAGARKAS